VNSDWHQILIGRGGGCLVVPDSRKESSEEKKLIFISKNYLNLPISVK
jgi:hypothetical protein